MSQSLNEYDIINGTYASEGVDSPLKKPEQLLSPTSKLKISPPKDLNKK
jgi:hypothetical protein